MDEISDDEELLRHIPAGTLWQAPGPRITSANFLVRHERSETGVSVNRLIHTTPARLLELVGGDVSLGSRIAKALARDVRQLGLRVVPMPLPNDPGHAEIQSDKTSLDDQACRKRLASLFRFLHQES